jgi:hypothetical protein
LAVLCTKAFELYILIMHARKGSAGSSRVSASHCTDNPLQQELKKGLVNAGLPENASIWQTFMERLVPIMVDPNNDSKAAKQLRMPYTSISRILRISSHSKQEQAFLDYMDQSRVLKDILDVWIQVMPSWQ